MSTLSWPKTIIVFILAIFVAAAVGVYMLGHAPHEPEQVTISKPLALPGTSAAPNAPAAPTLPDMPAPRPLPGAAQTP